MYGISNVLFKSVIAHILHGSTPEDYNFKSQASDAIRKLLEYYDLKQISLTCADYVFHTSYPMRLNSCNHTNYIIHPNIV